MLNELYRITLKMMKNEDGREYAWAMKVDEICSDLFDSGSSERIVNAVVNLARCRYWGIPALKFGPAKA